MHCYIFYCQFSPPLCYAREGVFTNKQYCLCYSIPIKMASQPCGGTIANIADTLRAFIANVSVSDMKQAASLQHMA